MQTGPKGVRRPGADARRFRGVWFMRLLPSKDGCGAAVRLAGCQLCWKDESAHVQGPNHIKAHGSEFIHTHHQRITLHSSCCYRNLLNSQITGVTPISCISRIKRRVTIQCPEAFGTVSTVYLNRLFSGVSTE